MNLLAKHASKKAVVYVYGHLWEAEDINALSARIQLQEFLDIWCSSSHSICCQRMQIAHWICRVEVYARVQSQMPCTFPIDNHSCWFLIGYLDRLELDK